LSFVKKHIIFVISGAIAVVLLLMAILHLASSAKSFKKEKNSLKGAVARLQQLHSRNPYPSVENVKKEEENVANLLQAYSSLSDNLRRGQVEEEKMEAADFMPLLEKTLRNIRSRFDDARVGVPANFTFGFDKYAGGQLPDPEDIPRLVQQLRIVEALCNILAFSGISDLSSISRDVFETGGESSAPARTGRAARRSEEPAPSAGPAAQKGMEDVPYSTQSFNFVFKAREHALFGVLNQLASDKMFIVVRSITISNKGESVQPRTPSKPLIQSDQPSQTVAELLPRDQRVILRKEDLEVLLDLDIYHFQSAMAAL
jgi:hypothetical protein